MLYNSKILSKIQTFICGDFMLVRDLKENNIPNKPGIYCIKLGQDVEWPSKFGKIREDRIIYIGMASVSLKERLWREELHDLSPATFFRSIGTILGYWPPKGSMIGKRNHRNYRFSPEDKKKIQVWMQQSLLVNFILLPKEVLEDFEKKLIKELRPLVNIKHNPTKSKELQNARKRCINWANMKPDKTDF